MSKEPITDSDKALGKHLQRALQAKADAVGRQVYSCSPNRTGGVLRFLVNTGRSTQVDGWRSLDELETFLADPDANFELLSDNPNAKLPTVRVVPRGPDEKPFMVGRIARTHALGDIAIVEAVIDTTGEILFHPYVNRVRCGVYAVSLDGALLLALAFKHGEMAAARYAARVLGIPER